MKKLILMMSILMLNMYGQNMDLYDIEEGKDGLYHVKVYREKEKKNLAAEYYTKSKEDIGKKSSRVIAIGEVRIYQKNGYLEWLYHVQNGKLNGMYQAYSETVNGRLITEVMVKNGVFVGKETMYFDTPEKKIKQITTYNDKGLQALIEMYYDNGQLRIRMNLYGERKEGETIEYDRDGKVIFQAIFKNNVCISGDCEKYNKKK